MPRTLLLAAAACFLCLSSPISADEIDDQLEAARADYNAGELRKAMQSLQLAIASIQDRLNQDLLKLLPGPLQGWQAEEPKIEAAGMAAMISGTNLSRRYLGADGAELEVSITADSPLMPMMTMMLVNPMMLELSPGAKIYSHAGRRGTIQHEEGSDGWEISLLVTNDILVQVEGRGLTNDEAVIAYLKAIDLDAIENAFRG